MDDSNNNNASNRPYYPHDGTGDRQSASSRPVSGLLGLLDIATSNNPSMHHNQTSVNGGHDCLIQTLLLRRLLSSNTPINRSHDPHLSALFGNAAAIGFYQPGLSDLALRNLLNSNSNTDINSVANQYALFTRYDAQLGNPLSHFPVTSPVQNDLLRCFVAIQNNSLRELSVRLNGVPDATPASTSFLALPPASQFVPGNTALRQTQPLLGKAHEKGDSSFQAPLPNLSSIPDHKSRSQESNDPRKTSSEGDYTIPVFTEDEKYVLSEYQSFLRQQMVYVETKSAAERKGGKTQGRNKPITAHQVGVMCVHCAQVPHDARPRGAVYYPATLEGLYQAAQNMSKNHFEVRRCQAIPDHVQDRLIDLKRTKSVNVGTGKDYWKKSAENIGICEVDSRLFFEKSLVHSKR